MKTSLDHLPRDAYVGMVTGRLYALCLTVERGGEDNWNLEGFVFFAALSRDEVGAARIAHPLRPSSDLPSDLELAFQSFEAWCREPSRAQARLGSP